MDTVFEAFRNFLLNLQMGVVAPLGGWNYLLLAFLVALEGPIVTLLGALAGGSGVLSVWLVFAAAATGNLVSDIFWFQVGQRFQDSTKIVERFGWLGLSVQQIERMTTQIRAHAPMILFLAKLTGGLMIPTLIATGLVRAPFKKWFPPLFLGETIWTGMLVFVGFHGGFWLAKANDYLKTGTIIGSLIFIIVFFIWLHYNARKEIE